MSPSTVAPSKGLLVIGLLLSYPDEELFSSWDELIALLEHEGGLGASRVADLRRLLPGAGKGGVSSAAQALLDAQERYSATFDGGRRTSLHLFEHVHGDGKQRGQALVELTERYTALGVQVRHGELPDYLPALCELASMGPSGQELLVETRPVVQILEQNLVERGSPYAAVVRALVDLLSPKLTAAPAVDLPIAQTTTTLPPPIDLDELDREWAESPVEFGVGAAHDALVPLRRSRDAEALPQRS